MKRLLKIMMVLAMISLQLSAVNTYAATTPYFVTSSNGTKYFYNKEDTLIHKNGSIKVYDVSAWDGKIDWDTLANSDMDAVIIRVGHGVAYEDIYWEYNVSECNRLNIPYGLYFYSVAYDYDSAKEEADHLCELLSKQDINLSLPIFYDLEQYTSYTVNDQAIVAPSTIEEYETIVSCFIDEMSDLGYEGKVHVYSYEYYLNNRLNSPSILPYVTWMANYGGKTSWTNSYVSNYLGWQYTSTINVDGIPVDAVDCSAFPADYITNCFNTTSAVNSRTPTSQLESFNINGNTITLSGYTYDLDDIRQSLKVNVYMNDTLIGSLDANESSRSFNKDNRISGKHKFSGSFKVNNDESAIFTVKVVDPQTKKEYVISDNITLSGNYTSYKDPVGNVETVSASTGSITIGGWAYDPDNASQSISIKAYIGSTCLGTVNTNITRSDVNSKFSISGKHGFYGTLSTSYTGDQTVTIKAVNLATGVEYTIGKKEITIPVPINTNYSPIGCVDSITAANGEVKVAGWAFDKDSSSSSINVKVYIDSTCLGTLAANKIRDDVNSAYYITGAHGFSGTLNTTLTGEHTVTVKAVDLKTNTEYTIGSETVAINATANNPLGNVEALTASQGSIKIDGWAYDPDEASQSISVKAYIGSTCLGTVSANLMRNDVNSAFTISGKHGFSGTLSTTLTGTQTVTIKAVDYGSGVEYTIGTQEVDIPVNIDPKGNLENVSATNGTIKIGGWAYDPNDASQSINIKAYIGSTCIGTLSTNQTRSDVNNAYSITGKHGFSGTLSTALTGTYTVTIKAVDADTGNECTIGSRLVTIPSPYTTKYNPIGNVEAITATNGTIKIRGWAYDPDDASQSISIKAYVGSTCIGTLSANQTRSDVNSAFSITGSHGFNGTLNTSLQGKQTITIKAVNLGSGAEYTIGSKSITIPSSYTTSYNPKGNVEAVTVADGSITIRGWAYDPDNANSSISVKAYIGSTCIGTLTANQTRSDVNNAFSITGNHGFNGILNTDLTGTQTVTIKAIDLGSGVEYTIGSKSVTISSPYTSNYNPKGNVETVAAAANSITISGWAYDPDYASQSISIKAYIGSTCLGTLNTNVARPDVNSKFSISGNHGFSGKLSTTLQGTQTVTIKAVDVNTGNEYTIGSKSVTIPSSYTTKSNPKGNVESITATNGNIKFYGWAYDPDDASQSISIKAYIGSTCIGTLTANQTRSDVNSAFSITGNHGFNGTVSTTLTGTQTVTIKAINLGSGVETTIGSKTLKIA